jgi:hypothetical protein
MAAQGTLEITLLSGACCNPSLASAEKDLEKKIGMAARELGLDARVEVVSLSAVLAGQAAVTDSQSQVIRAMFQRYGARMAPAAMTGSRFLFAGGVPTVEKMLSILQGVQPAEPRPVVSGCSCGGSCCG